MDWTGAGILGVAAQRWPFTQLPFSSARVKRSAGEGERRERGSIQGGGKRSPEGQKAGEGRSWEGWGVARSCVKSAHCSFKISHFLCRLLRVLVHRCSPLPRAPCSLLLGWNCRVQINQMDLNRNQRLFIGPRLLWSYNSAPIQRPKSPFFFSSFSVFNFKALALVIPQPPAIVTATSFLVQVQVCRCFHRGVSKIICFDHFIFLL